MCGIAGSFDRDGTVIIGWAGRTPGTVFFLHAQPDPAICTDRIVTACPYRSIPKTATDTFRGELTDDTVDRYRVYRMVPRCIFIRADHRMAY